MFRLELYTHINGWNMEGLLRKRINALLTQSPVIVGLEKVDKRQRECPNVVNISYGREQLPQRLHQQISAGSVKIGVLKPGTLSKQLILDILFKFSQR